MSIRDEINSRMEEGRLFLLVPSLPGESCVRSMFCSPEVWHELERAGSDPRTGKLLADLELFVTGGLITVSAQPYRHPPKTYVAKTDPIADEIWDIRSRDPSPGIRVLGGFAERDVFVALAIEYRENLGGPKSKQWRDFILRSKTHWRNLFSVYQRLAGENIDEYLSGSYLVIEK